MLTLLVLHLFLSPNASAQTNGTVPIEVIRLPEYPEEKPKNTDPVAAPVKPFGFENSSASGWYKGEGSGTPARKRSTINNESSDKAATNPAATTDAEATPYVEASKAGSSSSLSSTTNGTATTTTSNPNGSIDCDTRGIVNCEIYNQNRGGAVQGQVNKANQLANDQFNRQMGK
jgi:hypothetical protein